MDSREKAVEYANQHREAFLDDFIAFLRIPSISTLEEYKEDIQRAAEWVAGQLEGCGLESVSIIPTNKHPIVFGEWLKAGVNSPTILIYGHYDVQPADPIELWETDPFEPEIIGDKIYARGASDMKSLVLASIKALSSIARTSSEFPINIKVLIEGEEEIGSPSIQDFILDHKELLACDFILNLDAGILGPEIPSLTYGLRGIAYFDVSVETNPTDLHSGRYGGVVYNAGQVLCDLIAGMKDEQGKIQLPNFYQDVRPLSERQKESIKLLPTTDDWWKEQSGAVSLFGERGFSSTERASSRPTLDVNGLYCGFTGEGSKTVLPARAMAKISMRLVPDQTAEKIHRNLTTYFQENIPDPGIKWEVNLHHSARPVVVDLDSKPIKAAELALQKVWDKKPLFWHAGGSIALLGHFQEMLDVDVLMMGFFMHDDNIHAPNEKFHLPNLYRGIEAYIHFLFELKDIYSEE